MTLESQLAELQRLGLKPANEVTVDDLVHSFDRRHYEKIPFDFIFLVLGWNFDTECIYGTGDYASIVTGLCELSGDPNYLKDVRDFVDLESKTAWLKYDLNGVKRDWKIEVNNDWADVNVVSCVMGDIERDGQRFYFKDNGQAMVLYYLNSATADELNKLSSGALKPVLAD